MQGIKQILTLMVENLNKEEPPRLRPSIVGDCSRKTFFSIVEGKPEEEPAAAAVMVFGKLLERLPKPTLERMGFIYQPLVLVEREGEIFGHPDFVLFNGDFCFVLDIKTTAASNLPPHPLPPSQVASKPLRPRRFEGRDLGV